MVTVQQLVKNELYKKPILLDMFQQNLLNVSAVAETFYPTITKQLGKEVKLTAVSMAIRRVAENFSQRDIFTWEFPSDLEISTRSHIYELAIKRDSKIHHLVAKIREQLPRKIGTFLSVVDANYETVLISNQCNKHIIKKILKGKEVTSERDNLGYLTITFESYVKNIPGVYYQITRALALNNIPIQSFHTIGAEVIIHFHSEDLVHGYTIVKKLIENKAIL